MLTPVSMVNERKKVIVPEVGALPTLAIWNVYDPRTPGNKVVGPVMLGVRSGTGVVVVVVVVVGGTVVVVVVDGAPVVVVVVAGAGTAAGAVGGHESASARGASLKVSTVAPTAKAMTMAAPWPTPRRWTISRDTMPVAMKK